MPTSEIISLKIPAFTFFTISLNVRSEHLTSMQMSFVYTTLRNQCHCSSCMLVAYQADIMTLKWAKIVNLETN